MSIKKFNVIFGVGIFAFSIYHILISTTKTLAVPWLLIATLIAYMVGSEIYDIVHKTDKMTLRGFLCCSVAFMLMFKTIFLN